MEKWTKEEVENLIQLLFSEDQRNQLLALELIQTKPDANAFAAALFFLAYVEFEAESVLKLVKKITKKQCSTAEIDYWNRAFRVVKNYWEYTNSEFFDALEHFEKEVIVIENYLRLAPRYRWIYTEIGKQLIGKRAYKRGIAYLEKVTQLAPDSYDAHFDYAYNLKEIKKNADTIIKHYERCIVLNKSSFSAHHNLGRVYTHQKGNHAKAAAIYREAIALNPYSADTIIELALAEEELGNIEEARSLLESAIELDADSDLGHNNLAYMLWVHFKEYDTAKVHINKALELAPKVALYWHTLAEVEWYGYRDEEKAMAALHQALKVQKSYKAAAVMMEEINAERKG